MAVLLEIVECIGGINPMGLEKAVQGLPRPEPQQPTQLRVSEVTKPKLLDRQRFQARRDRSPVASRRRARSSGI